MIKVVKDRKFMMTYTIPMSRTELKNIISECINDMIFTYNGKPSGVTATVKDYVPNFQAWHGDKVKEYSTIDQVMEDKFYSGKSIDDLMGILDFTFI